MQSSSCKSATPDQLLHSVLKSSYACCINTIQQMFLFCNTVLGLVINYSSWTWATLCIT